ncbi:MAG TPA: hypothetical protein VIL37_08425 [Natronosporangium sp.]
MPRLDPLTIERVAQLICDIDGPYERRGVEIQRFLQRARWPGLPRYDGSPRVPWLIDVLRAHADDAAAVDRLICRICDPLEFNADLSAAKPVADELNRILAPEQLAVSYVSGRPVLGHVAQDDEVPQFEQPPDLAARLDRLIADKEVVSVLIDRAEEASICQRGGAFALAIIGLGSFVEGLLHGVITERDDDVRNNGIVDSKGRRIRADRAGLSHLLAYAHGKQWIQTDAKDFMEKVREYRNFVHPRHQIEYGLAPDLDTVRMCWAPVHALLNDLESALLSPSERVP